MLQSNEGELLPTRRDIEERKTRSLDHVYGFTGLHYIDVMKSVMELDEELIRQDRGGDDVWDHIVLRAFDIKLQDVYVLQL